MTLSTSPHRDSESPMTKALTLASVWICAAFILAITANVIAIKYHRGHCKAVPTHVHVAEGR